MRGSPCTPGGRKTERSFVGSAKNRENTQVKATLGFLFAKSVTVTARVSVPHATRKRKDLSSLMGKIAFYLPVQAASVVDAHWPGGLFFDVSAAKFSFSGIFCQHLIPITLSHKNTSF